MRKVWNIILAMWRPLLCGLAAFGIVLTLFLFRLGTLTPGLSQVEITTYNETRGFQQIVTNSVNAPYKSTVFVATKIANNTFGLRLVGALIAVLSVGIFYFLALKFFSQTVSLITTLLFAASSLLLGVGRLATPTVMLLTILALITAGYFVRFSKRQDIAWICLLIIVGLGLYVPSFFIIILCAAIFELGRGRKSFENLSSTTIVVCSIVISLLLAPLVVNVIQEPYLWRDYVGLPENIASPLIMLKDTANAFLSIFIMSPENPVYWLGRQPILDICSAALFLFGGYHIVKNKKLDRFWLLLGSLLVIIIWAGVSSNQLFIVSALPILYLIMGFGLTELITRWYAVFPRNPIARSVGLSLVLIAVILTINFHIQRYFVAWPNNSSTKQTFSEKLPSTLPKTD